MSEPHFERLTFDSEELFQEHLMKDYKGTFPESQLQILTKTCLRSGVYRPEICPLCRCHPAQLPSSQNKRKHTNPVAEHIANHLLSLAMDSLPDREDIKGPRSDELNDSEEAVKPESLDVSFSGPWGSAQGTDSEEYSITTGPFQFETEAPDLGTLTREDEWGFSKWTSYPPYAGHFLDTKLESFRARAQSDYSKAP